MAWSDEQLNGEGFIDWYPFDHPQLGPIELGGWNTAFCLRNPPLHLLEAEVAPHADWAIWHILISPLLRLRDTEVERIGADTWRVRVVVENTGWLPTNVTAKAMERKIVRPLEAEITLPDGATLVGTEHKRELGQLGGRALRNNMTLFGGGHDGTVDRAKAEWVVHAPEGTVVQVEARHQRAGVVRTEVTLS